MIGCGVVLVNGPSPLREREREYSSSNTYASIYFKTHKAEVYLIYIDIAIYTSMVSGQKKNASNLASRAELGGLPVAEFIKFQFLSCSTGLYKDDINLLLKEAYYTL